MNLNVNYIDILLECWDNEPDNRPAMNQVVAKLKEIIENTNIITENDQISNCELNSQSSDNNSSSSSSDNINNSNSSQLIQINTKEKESKISPNNEPIVSIKNLDKFIDEIVDLIFKERNNGIDLIMRNQHISDYLNN